MFQFLQNYSLVFFCWFKANKEFFEDTKVLSCTCFVAALERFVCSSLEEVLFMVGSCIYYCNDHLAFNRNRSCDWWRRQRCKFKFCFTKKYNHVNTEVERLQIVSMLVFFCLVGVQNILCFVMSNEVFCFFNFSIQNKIPRTKKKIFWLIDVILNLKDIYLYNWKDLFEKKRCENSMQFLRIQNLNKNIFDSQQ